MTYKQFFEEIKNYWGDYAQTGTGVKTMEYVKNKKRGIAEQYLDLVLGRLMLTVSTQYNHVPDISDIYKAKAELAKEGAFENKKSQIEHKQKQIVQLDEEGKKEIEKMLHELNKKMGIKNEHPIN